MSVTIDPEASAMWTAMKSASIPKAWFVLSIDPEDKKKLVLTASGRCSVHHIGRFLDETQVSENVDDSAGWC